MVKVTKHNKKKRTKWCKYGCGKSVIYQWHKRKTIWVCIRCGKVNDYGGTLDEITATAMYFVRKISGI